MPQKLWPILGVLVVGTMVFIAIRHGHQWLPVTSEATVEQKAVLVSVPVSALPTTEQQRAKELLAARPTDGQAWLNRHGVRAARAFAALGDRGLSLLDQSADLPNLLVFIDSPLAANPNLKSSLEPVSEYLDELTRRDPAMADRLFWMMTRLGERQAQLLKQYPHALPIVAVSPALGADVIERFGDDAVQTMLKFTPDSYAEVARLLETDGERVFRVRRLLESTGATTIRARSDLLESFLALYFIEHGEASAWLEKRFGVESTLFFMSTNMDFLKRIRREHGPMEERAALLALQGYAESRIEQHRQIAELCMTVPGMMEMFVDLRKTPAIRDEFLTKYGRNGGATLIAMGYDRALWPDLIAGATKDGDNVLTPLAMLAEHPLLHKALAAVAKDPRGHTVLEVVRAVSHALAADGGVNAKNFMLAERTLKQVLDHNWNDIPDDYLNREVSFVWNLLPGRDAFRLVRLMLNGYSPSLYEMVSGGWDAANVVMFAYNAGTALIDCTAGVRDALGKQSFSGLAQALGVVAKDVAGNVFSRLVESISHPRNYVRLAVTAGYFAYDAFLTYAPMDIPNRAELLEINQKFLHDTMKGMFFDVVKEVGLQALVWRPAFDQKGLQIPEPMPGPDLKSLGQQERVLFELKRLDARVKNAFIELLDNNDRRRQFLKLLGMAEGMKPDADDATDHDEYELPNLPPLPPNNSPKSNPTPDDSEDMSVPRRPGAVKPTGAVWMDGQWIALQPPRFRNVTAGDRTLRATGRVVVVPKEAAGWTSLVRDPRYVAFCLEQITELMGRKN